MPTMGPAPSNAMKMASRAIIATAEQAIDHVGEASDHRPATAFTPPAGTPTTERRSGLSGRGHKALGANAERTQCYQFATQLAGTSRYREQRENDHDSELLPLFRSLWDGAKLEGMAENGLQNRCTTAVLHRPGTVGSSAVGHLQPERGAADCLCRDRGSAPVRFCP
jgi:hypothetical protein